MSAADVRLPLVSPTDGQAGQHFTLKMLPGSHTLL